MEQPRSEYAQSGVDYANIAPFKHRMQEVGTRTQHYSRRRGVMVIPCAHGVAYARLDGRGPIFCQTTEGLGNKNWISEWMAMHAGTGRSYYEGIGEDALLMAVNDLIAQAAMPALYTDEIAVGQDDWFKNEQRAKDLAESFHRTCEREGMTLGGGESPALKYLVNPLPPVKACPTLSGCASGLVLNDELRKGRKHRPGDAIIGVTSSGIHANGISLVIKRALELPDKFLTKLPNGNTLGDESLIPTRSYVALVEALEQDEVRRHINGYLPGTGGGVAKLATDKKLLTYRITNWECPIPPLFQFLMGLGVTPYDCLTTFNYGIGYYIFVDPSAVERVIAISKEVGYDLYHLGFVEEGERQVIHEPTGLILPPPGD